MIEPLPKKQTGGRPFNKTTNLGKIMDYLNVSVRELASRSGVSERLISDYLAGRKEIPAPSLAAFAEVFDVTPDLLTGKQLQG